MINENEVMKFNEAVQYVGKVKISIQDDKQILYTKEIHNKGTNNLLKFLVNSIAGQSQSLFNRLRPAKIALFKSSGTAEPDFESPDEWDEDYICSIPILYDSAPTIDTSTSGDYFTNFHFRIPYSFVKKAGEEVTKLALYPKQISNYFYDMLAWVSLDDEEVFTLPSSAPLGYTIIIDWELHFKN